MLANNILQLVIIPTTTQDQFVTNAINVGLFAVTGGIMFMVSYLNQKLFHESEKDGARSKRRGPGWKRCLNGLRSLLADYLVIRIN